jgi:hypothetical protein
VALAELANKRWLTLNLKEAAGREIFALGEIGRGHLSVAKRSFRLTKPIDKLE